MADGFAQGVDFGAAFKGSAPPNALETLNTLGQLNERRAQTQLYNLDSAIKQRDFNLLQEHGPNAFLGDEQAQTALSQSPQLLNQVLLARGQGVKNSLDTMNLQTHAKAIAAQYLNPFIGTPQFQTEALRVIQMLSPQIGPAGAQQLADIAVKDPQKLQALIQANLPSNDFETVTGVSGRTANRVEFERQRALKGAEPPVAGPPMRGIDPLNPDKPVPPILPQFNPNALPPPGPTMGPQSSSGNPGQLQAQLVNGLTNATQPLPPNAWTARIFGDEANNVATATNPNSSAKGLGQFIKSTWLDQMDKLHPELADKMTEQQILALRTDKAQGAALNQEATMGLAKDNADYLQSKNLPVTAATLAMAHKLGAQGAEKVLAAAIANPNTPMTSILSQIDPDSIRANPGWARMTVGAFINSNLQKYGNGPVGDLGQTQPPAGAAASPLAQAASEPVAQPAAAQDTVQPGSPPAIAPTPVVTGAPQAQPIPTDMAPAAQGGPAGAPPVAAAPAAGPQVAQASPPGMATPLGFGAPQLSKEQELTLNKDLEIKAREAEIANQRKIDFQYGSLGHFNEESGKAISQFIAKRQEEAYQGHLTLKAADDISKQLDNLMTGPGSTDIVKAEEFLNRFGVKLDNVLPEGWRTDTTKYEIALKNVNFLAAAWSRQMFPQRTTNNDLMVALQANINLDFNNPTANKQLVETLREVGRIKFDEAKFLREEAAKFGPNNPPNWLFQDRWIEHLQNMKGVPDNIKQAYLGFGGIAQHPEVKVEQFRTPGDVKEQQKNTTETGVQAPVVPDTLRSKGPLEHHPGTGNFRDKEGNIYNPKGELIPRPTQ